MDARRRKPVAGHGHRFAQVEGGHELPNGLLAQAHFVGRRRTKQPGGDRLLTGTRPRRRQQLEQAAASEQVEVVGVEMVGWPEAVSRLGAAHPLVAEPPDSAFVERHR